RLKGIDLTSPQGQEDWERSLDPKKRSLLPSAIIEILNVPDYQRSNQQKATLTAAYRKGDEARHILGGLGHPVALATAAHAQTALARFQTEKHIATLKKKQPQITTTMVMKERAKARMTHVHLGGDFLRKGVEVLPGVPASLHALSVDK